MTELHQKKAIQHHTCAEDVNILLAELPWGINKCGVSDSKPIHTMWCYLGPHFTTGSQQNDLLDMLRNCIITDPDLVGHLHVGWVELTEMLKRAATTRGTDACHMGKQ